MKPIVGVDPNCIGVGCGFGFAGGTAAQEEIGQAVAGNIATTLWCIVCGVL
jgi:hypothetical protein